ncbi:MAG: hypothetical protein L0332_10235 [Chloroflexi bacterium]|nr:hypothetical protein [Chloroflexota bacterium]MCI0576044.1 hypothetical protein [Chloroflexota bacterium]MCI0647832.1 hypothetical protein [Chloroflexota bacterium]MCI0727083.1 hypothetical protein [Chloroflexota bacterium]
MASATREDYQEVLETIRTWPTVTRLNLVQDVLKTVESDVNVPRTTTGTLEKALGLLATDAPPPTDEEVERLLEEERIRKYG